MNLPALSELASNCLSHSFKLIQRYENRMKFQDLAQTKSKPPHLTHKLIDLMVT